MKKLKEEKEYINLFERNIEEEMNKISKQKEKEKRKKKARKIFFSNIQNILLFAILVFNILQLIF